MRYRISPGFIRPRQMRNNDGAHHQESAGTGREVLKGIALLTGAAYIQVTPWTNQ